MLHHPNIVPSASINRWIVGIKTFHFDLVHIPSERHGPDGLSRRPPQPGDAAELEDGFDDWIDDLYGMMQLIIPPPCLSHAAIDPEPDSDTTTTIYVFAQQMSGPARKIPKIIPPSYNLFPHTDPTIRMDA